MTDDEVADALWEALVFHNVVSVMGAWGAEHIDRQKGGGFRVRTVRASSVVPIYSDGADVARLRLKLLVSKADRATITAATGSPPPRRKMRRETGGAWSAELLV